jgi:hypothetical protein
MVTGSPPRSRWPRRDPDRRPRHHRPGLDQRPGFDQRPRVAGQRLHHGDDLGFRAEWQLPGPDGRDDLDHLLDLVQGDPDGSTRWQPVAGGYSTWRFREANGS